jgi:hypothetical protein
MKPKLFIIALLIILVDGCTRAPLPELENGEAKVVTIKVDIAPETRVVYDGGTGNNVLSWQENDQLMMIGFNDNNQYQGYSTFTRRQDGLFQGNTVPGATKYKAFYPVSSVRLDNNGDPILENGNPSMPAQTGTFWQQTQVGNNSAAHIGNSLVLWDTEANSINQTFNLALKSSIIRLNLTGIPEDAGELHHLIYTVETATGVFKSVSIGVTEVTFSPTVSSITAYLAFDPTVVTKVMSGGKVIISLYAEKSYMWKIDAVTQEKTYAAGKRYTGSVSSGWIEIINPLGYVARYNVNPAGTGFVGDLTSCEGSGYFNWSEAMAISFANYHLPSRKEWRSIVPEAFGYVFFKTTVDENNITEEVTVRNQDITMTCDYRSLGTASNPAPSYALRYKGTDMLSAWKYEYFNYNTNNCYLKVTCCNVVPSVTIDDVANPNTWFVGNNVIRYFPASGRKTTYDYENLGKVGYFWSSTYDTNSKAYHMYFTSSVVQMYNFSTSNKYSVRLFYNAY